MYSKTKTKKQPCDIQEVQEIQGRPFAPTLLGNQGVLGLLSLPFVHVCLAHQQVLVLPWFLFDSDTREVRRYFWIFLFMHLWMLLYDVHLYTWWIDSTSCIPTIPDSPGCPVPPLSPLGPSRDIPGPPLSPGSPCCPCEPVSPLSPFIPGTPGWPGVPGKPGLPLSPGKGKRRTHNETLQWFMGYKTRWRWKGPYLCHQESQVAQRNLGQVNLQTTD